MSWNKSGLNRDVCQTILDAIAKKDDEAANIEYLRKEAKEAADRLKEAESGADQACTTRAIQHLIECIAKLDTEVEALQPKEEARKHQGYLMALFEWLPKDITMLIEDIMIRKMKAVGWVQGADGFMTLHTIVYEHGRMKVSDSVRISLDGMVSDRATSFCLWKYGADWCFDALKTDGR